MIFKNNERIVFAGDSVTDMGSEQSVAEGNGLGFGYVRYIDSFLGAYYPEINLRVTNSGVSGNNSRELLKRYDSDVVSLNADWVCICIGINDEPDIMAIERYENGKIKTAVKGNVIFSAAYTINAKMFHDIAEKAGCKIYAPAHCTVYADNRFIGIFPLESEINMNFDSARTEYISGAVSDNITVSSCGAAVFENKDL